MNATDGAGTGSSRQTRAPLLCLAASGGGHIRQLLDLEPLWKNYPHYFVTEDTALGRSIATQHETFFVPHFALGQARLGSPLLMLREALASFMASFRIVWRRTPDYLITTGAGSQLFITAWARLLGAKVVLIDSFARFDSPSAFARLAGWLAHVRIAQSAASGARWKGSLVRDPLRETGTAPPPKDNLLFATVGATLPFDRLTGMVIAAREQGLISEEVILQVGEHEGPLPDIPGMRIVRDLPFAEVQQILGRARIVICHGGTGSIITALRNHCATIVVPRRFELGEHYDNHQAEITEVFLRRGLVLTAGDTAELAGVLPQARTMTPVAVATDYSQLIVDLEAYIRTGLRPGSQASAPTA